MTVGSRPQGHMATGSKASGITVKTRATEIKAMETPDSPAQPSKVIPIPLPVKAPQPLCLLPVDEQAGERVSPVLAAVLCPQVSVEISTTFWAAVEPSSLHPSPAIAMLEMILRRLQALVGASTTC